MSEQSPCSHAPHQDAMPRLKPVENRGKAARHNPIHMRKDGRAHVSKSLSSRSYLRPRFPLFSPRTPRSAKRHNHQGTYRCTSPLPRKMSPCPDTTHTTTRKIPPTRSEEHTSELQSRFDLVCRLLLEKKKTTKRDEQQT